MAVSVLASVVASAPSAEPATLPIDGAAQVRALAEAYAGTIDEVAFRDGDWAVRIDSEWFFWSNGRMLPEKARERWERYAPLRFTTYRRGPARVADVEPRQALLLSEWIDRMESDMPGRHNGFLGALYGFMRSSQAHQTMVVTRLFGIAVRVHPMIVGPLHGVQRDVAALRESDAELDEFIRSIADVGGFHWRRVAGSQSLSLHSYGVAVDLVPRRFADRFVYWRWAAIAGVEQWWAIPMADRLLVPDSLIRIFERHGFIWGGRWVFFDQIHFEYRPEVIMLAGPAE